MSGLPAEIAELFARYVAWRARRLRWEPKGAYDADSVWKLGDDWFVGDVICNDAHAYLADGQYAEWLAALDRLSGGAGADTRLLVGHGEPTDRRAGSAQRAYIRTFVDAVAGAVDLEPAERASVVLDAMSGLVADDRLRFLMELSIEPVAQRMVSERDS